MRSSPSTPSPQPPITYPTLHTEMHCKLIPAIVYTSDKYCIAGTFGRRKCSQIPSLASHWCNFSPRTFGHATLYDCFRIIIILCKFLHELLTSYRSAKFSPSKFPAVQYWVLIHTMLAVFEKPMATQPLVWPSSTKSRRWLSPSLRFIPTKNSQSCLWQPLGSPWVRVNLWLDWRGKVCWQVKGKDRR